MKRAIFFDLDGTLWDALDSLTESWNEVFLKNNLPYKLTKDEMKSFMGLTPKETVDLCFKDVDYETGKHYFDLCLENEIKYLAKCPGTRYPFEEEVLIKLSKKYPLFIVSNSDKGYVENYLNVFNFNKYFIDHLCFGDLGLEKYQNILYLKEKYNIDDVIYVGDTNKDYIEASKAKVKFIHASYGFGVISEDVFKISSLEELESVVSKVFND